MFYNIKIKNKNYNVYYNTYNDQTLPPLVILHGWGVDSNIFCDIVKEIKYYVITIDLIGFGKSDSPLSPFFLEDYVNQVNQLITYLGLTNITLLGHSFGGRIAIKYNYYYNIQKLILVDSAGIVHNRFKTKMKVLKYKLKKKIYKLISKEKYNVLVTSSGSKDYLASTLIMKQTMSKIINVDLVKYCKGSVTPTLIIWGLFDTETKVKDAYKYYESFKNSKLRLFYNSSHFPFLEEKNRFIRVINEERYDI